MHDGTVHSHAWRPAVGRWDGGRVSGRSGRQLALAERREEDAL
jgi:hypothetical protein